MSDDNKSPLMGATHKRPAQSEASEIPTEATPLLSQSGGSRSPSSAAASSLQSIQSGKKSKYGSKLPSMIALSLLGLLAIFIMAFGFMAPALVEEYAKEALVIEPTNLSIQEFTSAGVKARIQANLQLDASRVRKGALHKLARTGTWFARKVSSEPTEVKVYVPQYGNLLLGMASIPGITVDIRNGRTTQLDFIADLRPGEVDSIRLIANDWLEGKLGSLRLQGKADIKLRSGLIPLGVQSISESFVFEGNDVPKIPQYDITGLNFREVQLPAGRHAMAADVSISVFNKYPIALSVPPLGFDIMVPNCADDDPHILLADATTDKIEVAPGAEVKVDVGAIVRQLPKSLTTSCPHSLFSPLDIFLGKYIRGDDNTIYVRGSNSLVPDQPAWIPLLLSSLTLPIPFHGHTFDNLIRNFTLADVHFGLPDPLADPDTPESNPQVSGNASLIAGLPKEMSFGVNVSRVRATADVFYKEKKLGALNLRKWQGANSTRIDATEEEDPALRIESRIDKAPLEITDDDVFTEVIQSLLFGGKAITLKIDAKVDVEVKTVLGKFVIRDVPAEGHIPVKPLLADGGNLGSFQPKVGDIKILGTSRNTISLAAKVNFTNPTEYTALVPYVIIDIVNNGSIIGRASAQNVIVKKGINTGIAVEAIWDPSFGGEEGHIIARELLSQYISGWNTTLTFQANEGTIPFRPDLGRALSKFNVTIPTPYLWSSPDGHESPHFIRDAVFHFFSSTASFTLLSPLQHSTIYIDTINATAFYNHTAPVGKIIYGLPFAVPPSASGSQTPKLPVDWSLDSVGYDAVRKALGGTLKLDAKAVIGLRMGQWTEEIWYEGSGIDARVSV